MMKNPFSWMLLFIPVAFFASAGSGPAGTVFVLAALAIIPLAKYIGESVEELASRSGSALGGVLSATFGNATELIIGLFALHAGLIDVVKASITGSIIGNLLLVLGLAMFAGGWKHKKQTFNKTAALAGGSSLFLGVIALIMPAIFSATAPDIAAPVIGHLSMFVALALLAMYGAGLFFSLHTHKHLFIEEAGKYEPRWSKRRALITLVAATLGVALMSDILVSSITPLITNFGWSPLFIGVIFLAIIGNAAEHYSAVMVAMKNRMDLSLQIGIGSATQIVMVVAPALVVLSMFMPQHMTLVFNLFELIAIVLSVLIVNLVVADGESNWLEGAQLLASYAIIATAFFFHP